MNRFQQWLYPELAVLEQRRDLDYKVRELMSREQFAPGREAIIRSVCFGVGFISLFMLLWWLLPRMAFVPPALAVTFPGTLALVGGWSIVLVNRMVRRKAIRRAMVRCGVPICIPCGYDLSKTEPSDPCPECGTAYPELGDPATALRLDRSSA